MRKRLYCSFNFTVDVPEGLSEAEEQGEAEHMLLEAVKNRKGAEVLPVEIWDEEVVG